MPSRGAGTRNRKAAIEAASDAADGSGGGVRSWTAFASAWVDARPTGGREALVQGTLRDQQGWRVEMLFRSDVTTAHRLTASWIAAGFALGIRSVADPDGRRHKLILLCEQEPL